MTVAEGLVDLDLTVGAGNVKVSQAGDARIRVNTGNVKLTQLSGDASMRGGVGNVKVCVPADVEVTKDQRYALGRALTVLKNVHRDDEVG